MTYLVVATDQASAARAAKSAGVKGRWVAVTPGNYPQTLKGVTVTRQDITWADITWAFPPDMLDAIRQVIDTEAT